MKRLLPPRLALPLLLLALAPLLAGCGAGGYVDVFVPFAEVVAENNTSSFPDTVMVDFVLWPSWAAPGGANLLPFALLPGEAASVASVDEDFYDADALMSDGFFDYVESWMDVYVPAGEVTTFFAY
ncbi:MAG: hypothetical protein ACKOSS_07795 [Planctomycetia bacterium]